MTISGRDAVSLDGDTVSKISRVVLRKEDNTVVFQAARSDLTGISDSFGFEDLWLEGVKDFRFYTGTVCSAYDILGFLGLIAGSPFFMVGETDYAVFFRRADRDEYGTPVKAA